MTPSRRDAKPEEMAGERASGCARIGASPQWLSEIDGYRKGLDEGGEDVYARYAIWPAMVFGVCDILDSC